jgi:hypothetical protein
MIPIAGRLSSVGSHIAPCPTNVVARLRSHGAELVGDIAQYEDIYRLCFLRGPEGIIIGVAEKIG